MACVVEKCRKSGLLFSTSFLFLSRIMMLVGRE